MGLVLNVISILPLNIVGQDLSEQLSKESDSTEEDTSEQKSSKSGENSKDDASTPLSSQESKLSQFQFPVKLVHFRYFN